MSQPRPLNPQARWESPIAHDFTADEIAIGRAGYIAFNQRKQARHWEALNAHERFRWCLAAHLVLQHGRQVTPAMIRSRYHVLVTQPSWDAVASPYRRRWEAVAEAMYQARTSILANTRVVISA